MTQDNTDADEVIAAGIAIDEDGKGYGNHSFTRRLRDFLGPVGNRAIARCLLFGHHWYLGDPVKFGPDGLLLFQQLEMDLDLPDELGPWICYCSRCGAGTRFDEPPEESIADHDYWCRTCTEAVDGEGIVQHARDDFVRDGCWPRYKRSSTHAPEER